ncbi:MAG: SRPBCC family protein [Thermaurantimonas sp.]|uniref:SRPBCC family protein n=1 Tax=Thermaurantimonas sp. TaxID=2681568 RepID=UPI00391C587C
MKIARFILYFIIAVIVLIYGISFTLKSEYTVERTAEINADYETVFPLISNLKEMRKWSPWHDRDPNMKETYEGTDGAPGSIHRWKGNDQVGEGEQEILSIRPDRIDIEVRFSKPFESKNQTWLAIDTRFEDVVTVTWGFTGKIPRPFNLMLLFSNFEEAIGRDYEDGLNRLKQLAEQQYAEKNPYRNIYLQDVNFQPRFFVYKVVNTSFDKMLEDALKVSGDIEEKLNTKGIKPFGNLVIYINSQSENSIEAHVGFPLEQKVSFQGLNNSVLPEGEYHFLPIPIGEYTTADIPKIMANKLRKQEASRAIIDLLEYAQIRETGKGLIGVFVLK